MAILGNQLNALTNKIKENIVISSFVALIGILSSIFGLWQYAESKYYFRENVITRLKAIDAERDFTREYEELRKIKYKDNLKDIYSAYAAVLSVKNGTLSTGAPDAYVRDISPDSEFYLKGQSALVMYYSSLYKGEDAKLAAKLSEIADNIRNEKGEISQYFYLKLFAIYSTHVFTKANYDYESIERLYLQFVNRYKGVLDFSTYDLHFHRPDKGFVIIDDGIQAPTLVLFFHIMLVYSANLHGDFGARDKSLMEIQRILHNKNYTNLHLSIDNVMGDMAMSGLGNDLMSRINLDGIQPNPAVQGTLRDKAAQHHDVER